MLTIKGKNIEINRGNILPLTIEAQNDDETSYVFRPGDVLRFKVFQAKNVNNVFLQKDFTIDEETTQKDIVLTAEEMKIGEPKSKPIDYWYEVELNPDTEFTQTIIGYTKQEGAAILTISPEGGDKVD